jgi:hypothetical protein
MKKATLPATLLAVLFAYCAISCESIGMNGVPTTQPSASASAPAPAPADPLATATANQFRFLTVGSIALLGAMGITVRALLPRSS